MAVLKYPLGWYYDDYHVYNIWIEFPMLHVKQYCGIHNLSKYPVRKILVIIWSVECGRTEKQQQKTLI